jgi:hypothetical protein
MFFMPSQWMRDGVVWLELAEAGKFVFGGDPELSSGGFFLQPAVAKSRLAPHNPNIHPRRVIHIKKGM